MTDDGCCCCASGPNVCSLCCCCWPSFPLEVAVASAARNASIPFCCCGGPLVDISCWAATAAVVAVAVGLCCCCCCWAATAATAATAKRLLVVATIGCAATASAAQLPTVTPTVVLVAGVGGAEVGGSTGLDWQLVVPVGGLGCCSCGRCPSAVAVRICSGSATNLALNCRSMSEKRFEEEGGR